MFIVSQLLLCLACIHLFWIYFFITGTLVQPKEKPAPDLDDTARTKPFLMADLVITTVTGIAISGFVILIFGFISLLSAGAFLLWLIIEGLLFKVLRQENVFGAEFWLRRFKLVKRAWSLRALIIYCVFLIISVPAILPPIAFDAISYHLAYAIGWANAGQIYTDELLRTPYYANNFLLLYALMFALKIGPLCHFLTWLCGLLTGLGVYSVIAQEAAKGSGKSNPRPALRISLTAVIIALGLALSPVFLRWVNTGFLDTSIGLFLLIPVLCIYLGLQTEGRKYEHEFILTAAFSVGMKIVLIVFLPLFIASLILLLMKRGRPLSRVIVMASLLLVLSAPWYVRNLIGTGDPISPVLNMLLKRKDPIWSPGDYAAVMPDLKTPKDPGSLIRLPYDLFWNTSSKNFREYGTSPVVMLLYVPVIMAILLLFGRVRRWFGAPFIYLNVALIYILAYWMGISSLARYFLHLFPLYLVYIGVWLNTLLRASGIDQKTSRARHAANLLITVCLALVMFFPNLTTRIYYEELVQSYLNLADRFESYRGYLRKNLPGYASTQHIIANLNSNHNQDHKVMVVGFENLAYYFRKNRIVSFGDWFGIGRHVDLVDSINRGDLSSYLAKFNVGAVLINSNSMRMDQATYLRFTKQLEENNFVLQPPQENGTVIYIKAKKS
jgi:hypothetical protein